MFVRWDLASFQELHFAGSALASANIAGICRGGKCPLYAYQSFAQIRLIRASKQIPSFSVAVEE
jgi:hypothetical protein